MAFTSGTVDVGADAVRLCPVGEAGVRVKNLGGARVFVGGAGVGTEGESQGYPLDPGTAEVFHAPAPKESPMVPAPSGDLDPAVLYARAAPDGGIIRVSWIASGD